MKQCSMRVPVIPETVRMTATLEKPRTSQLRIVTLLASTVIVPSTRTFSITAPSSSTVMEPESRRAPGLLGPAWSTIDCSAGTRTEPGSGSVGAAVVGGVGLAVVAGAAGGAVVVGAGAVVVVSGGTVAVTLLARPLRKLKLVSVPSTTESTTVTLPALVTKARLQPLISTRRAV